MILVNSPSTRSVYPPSLAARRWLGLLAMMLLALSATLVSAEEPSHGPTHIDVLRHRVSDADWIAMIEAVDPAAAASLRAPATPIAPTARAAKSAAGRQVVNEGVLNAPQVNRFSRAETTLAGRRDGLELVAAWNDAEGFCGPPWNQADCPAGPPASPGRTGYGFSTDRGATWIDAGAPPVGSTIGFGPGSAGLSQSGVYVTRADPALAVGKRDFYFVNLAIWDDNAGGLLGEPAGLSLHTGRFDENGTFAWDPAKTVLLQSPGFPNDRVDKEFVAVDRGGDQDKIYVTVSNFIEVEGIPQYGYGQIEMYYSHDSGASWQRSIIQPDETLQVVGGDIGVIDQGSEPAVGRDGTVYVAWERGGLYPFFGGVVTPEIRVSRSDDGGATWLTGEPGPGKPAGRLVSKICSRAFFPPPGYGRAFTNDYPRIEVGKAPGVPERVFVTYHDCRIANGGTQEATGGLGNQDADVYIRYSDDKAETWSEPIRIAGGGDGLIQFWPDVSVQANGDVNIVYYESDPTTCLVSTKWARSRDGGDTWSAPVDLSSEPSNWCTATSSVTNNFGDYLSAISLGNRLYATWADGRDGVPEAYFASGQ